MKRYFSVVISFVMMLVVVGSLVVSADDGTEFNEFGIKENVSVSQLDILNGKEERNNLNGESDWNIFKSGKPVDLTKEWSINFSDIATHDKIDAIVIEKNSQFIPVTITFDNSKQIKVKAKDGFAGSSSYVLKILLSNGKKYKMDFTTIAASRYADVEPNNTHLDANDVYLNETVRGEVSKKDVDYYRVEVPVHGTLNVNLKGFDGVGMSLSLYGSEGRNNNAMTSRSNFTQGGIAEGLMPGTYYIRVSTYYDLDESSYELEINFDKSLFENDNGTDNYVKSNSISLNQRYSGHIGYFKDYRFGNYNDYFKIEVKKHGTINVDLTGYNKVGMYVALYGNDGPNSNPIVSKSNFTQGEISEGLMPGTYYIRVSTYYESDYSPYTLDVNFVESGFTDDIGETNYLFSKLIGLNQSLTGHIGYFNGYRSSNYNDYYKFEVQESGTLNLDLTGYNRVGLSLLLYGSKGNNEGAIASKSNFTSGNIIKTLEPGTYYARVTTYYESDYSNYKLDVSFDGN